MWWKANNTRNIPFLEFRLFCFVCGTLCICNWEHSLNSKFLGFFSSWARSCLGYDSISLVRLFHRCLAVDIVDDWLATNLLKYPARESSTVVRRDAVLHQISESIQSWFNVFELARSTPTIIGSTFFLSSGMRFWCFWKLLYFFFSLFTPPLQLHLPAGRSSFLCLWLSPALLASIAWSIWVTMSRCVLEWRLSMQNVQLTIRVQVLSLFRKGTHPFPIRKTRFN